MMLKMQEMQDYINASMKDPAFMRTTTCCLILVVVYSFCRLITSIGRKVDDEVRSEPSSSANTCKEKDQTSSSDSMIKPASPIVDGEKNIKAAKIEKTKKEIKQILKNKECGKGDGISVSLQRLERMKKKLDMLDDEDRKEIVKGASLDVKDTSACGTYVKRLRSASYRQKLDTDQEKLTEEQNKEKQLADIQKLLNDNCGMGDKNCISNQLSMYM